MAKPCNKSLTPETGVRLPAKQFAALIIVIILATSSICGSGYWFMRYMDTRIEERAAIARADTDKVAALVRDSTDKSGERFILLQNEILRMGGVITASQLQLESEGKERVRMWSEGRDRTDKLAEAINSLALQVARLESKTQRAPQP